MTYARARLWLGISSVGTFVVLASFALALGLPQRAWPHGDEGFRGAAVAWIQVLVIYGMVSMPFDLLGGYLLPRGFGRSHPRLARFATRWLRGVACQSFLMLASFLLILGAGLWGGRVAAFFVVAILTIAVVAFRARIATLLGGMRMVPAPPQADDGHSDPAKVWLVQASDESFCGGVSGLPGFQRLIVPARWIEELPGEQLAIQLLRRQGVIRTGSGTRGIALAMAWNLAGFLLAALAPGSGVTTVAGLATLALWFTLWSFVGLLLLPTPSRAAVFEMDRYAIQQGAGRSACRATMERLDRWQDDEPARPRGVEAIFHPVPSITNRMQRLGDDQSVRGAYQAARLALPLSWVCLGFLGRAVHCNCGRPELWVMLPGD